MYSQDPKVRRRKLKLRFFAYGVMTIATITLATLSIFYVLGYRLDDSFDVARGALVKFDSRPRGANVTVDGTVLDTTAYQANLAAGEHTVSYSLKGYQGWQKTITLKPGEVRWLNYARLLPTSITTSSIEQLSGIQQAKASPDRQWYLLHQQADRPTFTLVDVRDEEAIESDAIGLPPESYGGTRGEVPGTFAIDSWSNDSDFFLVKHTAVNGTVSFIRVPRADPQESVNLTQLFNLNLKKVIFASNTAGTFYATDANQTLYRLDINNPDETIVIGKRVSAFDDLSASKLAFVSPAKLSQEAAALGTKKNNQSSVKIWQREGEEATEIYPVPSKPRTSLAYHQYFNREYIGVVSGNNVTVIEAPLESSRKTVLSDTLQFTPSYSSISPGNRFLLVQNGKKAYVYDIELDQSFPFDVPGQKRSLQWLDDHHLAYTGGGSLRLKEFDGTNTQLVTSVRGQHDVLIGASNGVLLSIGTDTGGPAVQRSFLLNEADR